MKQSVIQLFCFVLMLAGCTSADIPATNEGSSKKPNNRPADIVEGTYKAEAVLYKGEIVLFKDNPKVADLYDTNWVSVYNDGTFGIQDGIYWKAGQWGRIEIEDYDNTYLFSQETAARGTSDSHAAPAESKHDYIGYLTKSDKNTFVLVDKDAEDSEMTLIYVREGTNSTYLNGSGDSTMSTSDDTASAGTSDYSVSSGQKNALQTAKNYIKYMPFSRKGLIDQLEYEGYTRSEAEYGADNCGADWYEQAVLKAEQYLEYMSFSYSELYDQLIYEGFSETEARHGVDSAY